MKKKLSTDFETALNRARQFAKEGPRVAAVLKDRKSKKYCAIAGFIDEDLDIAKQVCLVTPDGRAWHTGENVPD